MLFLWWIGAPVEQALGRARYALIYVVSGLAGAAGALLLTAPRGRTVGASGALFGILGAAFVFERQRNYVLGGGAVTIIVLNLAFTLRDPRDLDRRTPRRARRRARSRALALSRLGRAHATYGRRGSPASRGWSRSGSRASRSPFWAVAGYL